MRETGYTVIQDHTLQRGSGWSEIPAGQEDKVTRRTLQSRKRSGSAYVGRQVRSSPKAVILSSRAANASTDSGRLCVCMYYYPKTKTKPEAKKFKQEGG